MGATVYLAPLPDGPVTVLTGVAAVTYLALAAGEADPSAEVARELGVAPEDVDMVGVWEFAEELHQAGLLAWHPSVSEQ